jgi:hypothetical protein
MLKKLLTCSALTAMLTLTPGCYSTSEGHVRPGVPFVKDSIQSSYEMPMATVHDAAIAVLQKNGEVTGDDVVKRVVSGVAFGRKIWISFSEDTPGITTVTTQARSSAGGPDVEIASEIDKRIYGQLARSQTQ